MNTKNNYTRYLAVIIAGSVAVILVPQFYSADGRILSAGDYGWPFDFKRYLEVHLSTWADSYGFGNPASRQHASVGFALIGTGFQEIGLSGATIQQLFFTFTVIIAGFGCLSLGKSLNWPAEQRSAFCILYLLSSVALNYWTPEHGLILFAYYWLPPTLAMALCYLRTRNYACLLALLLLSFNPSFSNPVFFVLYAVMLIWFLFMVPGIANIAKSEQRMRAPLALVILFSGSIVWLLPFSLELPMQYQIASNATAGLISDRETAILDSIELPQALIASGGGIWVAGAEFAPGIPYRIWGGWTQSTFFIFVHILALIVAIIARPREEKGMRQWLVIIASYLFVIIFTAGMRSPFPLNLPAEIILSIPGLGRGFRSVFIKFGFLLAFFWALVMSYMLRFDANQSLVKRRLHLIMFSSLIFVLVTPFFRSEVNRSQINFSDEPIYVDLPSSYLSLPKISAGDHEVPPVMAILPLKTSYNVHLRWGVNSGYVGAEFLRILWQGTVLSFDDNTAEYAVVKDICDHFGADKCLEKLIDIGVEYFMLRKDTVSVEEGFFKYKNIVHKAIDDGSMEPILTTPEFDLYRAPAPNPYNYVLNSENCMENCNGYSLVRMNGSILRILGEFPVGVVKRGYTSNNWFSCYNIGEVNQKLTDDKSTINNIFRVLKMYIDGECRILSDAKSYHRGEVIIVYRPYLAFILGCGYILLITFAIVLISLTQNILLVFKKMSPNA